MAVTGTLAAGADAHYPFGGMTGGEAGKDGKPAGEYYLSPTQKGEEPPGKWMGEGLADLGIHDGQPITKADEAMFAKIYGEFQDTRDPSGETTLGRPQGKPPSGSGSIRRSSRPSPAPPPNGRPS